MNKRLKILLLFTLCCLSVTSQTLEEAKTLFLNKRYEQALPAFKNFIQQQPTNPNINYWYGVCLLKTDNTNESLKFLELSDKRKVLNAPLFLGEAYEKLYRFDKALSCYESYRNVLLKRKETSTDLDMQIQRCKNGQNLFRGVEKVCVIDSFTVDKAHFLNTYKLSSESGKLYFHKDFFHVADSCNSTVYETERGNRIYYGELNAHGQINLYTRIKTFDTWSSPTPLPANINMSGNANYPFLMDDGVTIYYASDGGGSMGGYDIFVTRYDTDKDSYLNSDNVGMPFNSPYNDYMLAIDERNNLGWFASDRYQTADKVCIYVFIPNSSKQIYDSKSITPKKLEQLAQLHAISETWYDRKLVDDALTRLEKAMNKQNVVGQKVDFTFIVDDTHIYHHNSDFRSNDALQQFKVYKQTLESYQQVSNQLNNMRDQYGKSTIDVRNTMASGILDLEKQELRLETEKQQQAVKVRNLEIQELNK